ncbi:cyclic pyranopterin monophosphate synthase MoaC [Pendulispora brunnea]|uniref:Cyclic pyranopterin monophosphate synthase n=1 Tax=Pendulispora brunnea TaxID=2905690 RepID=A0ABZ2KFR7_9BACT
MKATRLTHLNEQGEAHMVDVGAKDITVRQACARARVTMQRATVRLLREGKAPKGDVLAAARIAGIMAAKRTPELIPLCHGIALTRVTIEATFRADGVDIECRTEARDRTGVEMEAMVGASVAALTLYDMLKAVDRAISYEVALLEKTGGKSGDYTRQARKRKP